MLDIKIKEVSVVERIVKGWRQKDYARYRRPARVYIHHANEDILENLVERRSRPYDLYRKLVLSKLDMFPRGTRFRWSQRAGCSCPCSPGFIAGSPQHGPKPFDVHITITTENKE